jgi:hypothetical protein
MKSAIIAAIAALALAAPALLDPVAAEAKGCIKGAIAGGVAGHLVHHGVVGAIGGCIVGHHMANQHNPQPSQAQNHPPAEQQTGPKNGASQ